MSSDLMYSSRIRSVNKGTIGRSQRTDLMSAGGAGSESRGGPQLGAGGGPRPASWLAARGAHYATLADLPHV
ncbi:unnamed protein product [Colias eurytheme]|nr:unnamed protein product [Colias eurytheme]